uniref:Uncharacterized protein n=1 Tax=Trypanosoma vivax (strain Y486) TaxID=1055687 RepID=G0TUT1_TRYVY|nr:conserved hypothetical protein [Trypanosoma vivax Y486]
MIRSFSRLFVVTTLSGIFGRTNVLNPSSSRPLLTFFLFITVALMSLKFGCCVRIMPSVLVCPSIHACTVFVLFVSFVQTTNRGENGSSFCYPLRKVFLWWLFE